MHDGASAIGSLAEVGLDDVPVAVLLVGRDGTATANPAARRLLQLTEDGSSRSARSTTEGLTGGTAGAAANAAADGRPRGRADGRAGEPGWIRALHPADRGELDDVLAMAWAGGTAESVLRLTGERPGGEAASVPSPEVILDLAPPRELARYVEVTAGPAAAGAAVVLVLTDVTEAVRSRRVLHAVSSATSIADDQGRRLWGPMGHEVPEDGGRGEGSMGDRAHPEDLSVALDAFAAVRRGPGARAKAVLRVRHPALDGHWVPAEIEMINAVDDPAIGGIVVHARTDDEPQHVASLARTSSAYLSVAEAAPVGIVLGGPRGLPIYFNEAARRLLPGIGVDEGEERDWIALAEEGHRPALQSLVADAVVHGRTGSALARFWPASDQRCWLMVTVSPRRVEDDRVVGLVTTLQDVTREVDAKEQLEAAQQRLVHLATHDALTGLMNRPRLTRELVGRLARPGAAVGVLFSDLDGFKAVNDRHGHAVGDALLAEVATRLVALVGDEAVVARVGGDEFVVVVDHDDADLRALSQRLIDGMADPFVADGEPTIIGVSLGSAVGRSGEDPEDVLRRADQAMYRAKAQGRNRAVHHEG